MQPVERGGKQNGAGLRAQRQRDRSNCSKPCCSKCIFFNSKPTRIARSCRHRICACTPAAARSRPCWYKKRSEKLCVGDVALALVGAAYGKISALFNDKGKQVKKKAGPSIPVEIMGLSDVPAAGDRSWSYPMNARRAKPLPQTGRHQKCVVTCALAATSGPRVSLETFTADARGLWFQNTLNLVIKADGQKFPPKRCARVLRNTLER